MRLGMGQRVTPRVGLEGPQRVRGAFRVVLGLHMYHYIRLRVW